MSHRGSALVTLPVLYHEAMGFTLSHVNKMAALVIPPSSLGSGF